MARTITGIPIGVREEESCMGSTCLKWRSNGELNEHDVALILHRLCEADPEACAILDTPAATDDP